ncbi:hypothetical protein [Pseudomonas plecoglossicida]|uniref:hypothetical protein n=1 Tax=Pseudomonas plecoglossicida TaxID=70775 RepID=UPI00051CE02F|nr:hypothetical protein [Pseudomonas plecoglossicida]KGK25422.1 hypothetical protein GT93_11410 [Pseudomonas plecoglossicida]
MLPTKCGERASIPRWVAMPRTKLDDAASDRHLIIGRTYEQDEQHFDRHHAKFASSTDAQHSTQHLDQSVQDVDLSVFLEAFSQDIAKISDQTVAQTLRSDVETIRLQNNAPSPKKSIIKECLGSIKTILEGAAGGALASYLPAVTTLLGAF